MNMNENPTAQQLAALFGAKRDLDGAYTLWVGQDGGVHLDLAGEDGTLWAIPRLRYAPFEAGVGFVGEDAAGDVEMMGDLLMSLIEQWSAARNSPPGILLIDLDDPESGPDWTLTEVATVDDNLLDRLDRGRSPE